MNTLLHWLTSPEWAAVVKTLLHSLWQGALIAAIIALLLRRIANPTVRYRLALGGLGAVILAAIVTWGVFSAPKTPAPSPMLMVEPAVATTLSATGPIEKVVVTADWKSVEHQIQWTAWLALVWLLGASVMLGRASVKVAGAEQLRRSCQPLNDPRVTELLAEARRAVNLTRQVRVAVTRQLTSPAVVGVLVPTLILPLTLITTLSPEQIRFVLLHELAHIRRGDYLANLFQLFAEALLFFNPAVWWISHQIRCEREACCDSLAIELSGAPADYARTLVHVAENILVSPAAAAPAFGNEQEPSSLADRIQRLLVPGYRPSLRLTWRAMLAALAVGGVMLGLLAVGARQTVAAALSDARSRTDSPASSEVTPVGDSDFNTLPKISYDQPGGQSRTYMSYRFAPLYGIVEIHENGTYWKAGKELSLDELAKRFSELATNSAPAMPDAIVQTYALATAPLESIRNLTQLTKQLGITNKIFFMTSFEKDLDRSAFRSLRRYEVDVAQFLNRVGEKTGIKMALDDYGKALLAFGELLANDQVNPMEPAAMILIPSDAALRVFGPQKELESVNALLESLDLSFSSTDVVEHPSLDELAGTQPVVDAQDPTPPVPVVSNGLMKKVTLSTSGYRAGQPVEMPNSIKVRADGSYWVGGRQLTLSEIRSQLTTLRSMLPPVKLFVHADAQAPAESLIALDRLRTEVGIDEAIGGGDLSHRTEALRTRRFSVDLPQFLGAARKRIGELDGYPVQQTLIKLWAALEVKPRTWKLSEPEGPIMMRATAEELESVEQFIQATSTSDESAWAPSEVPPPRITATTTPTPAVDLSAGQGTWPPDHRSEGDDQPILVLDDGSYEWMGSRFEWNKLRERITTLTAGAGMTNLTIQIVAGQHVPFEAVARLVDLLEELGVKTGAKLEAAQNSSQEDLYTRTYKVDTNRLAQALGLVGPVAPTNAFQRVRQFFEKAGVDFQPPKTMFYKDTQGLLRVRATLEDLDVIENAIAAISKPAPQIHIETRILEMPEDQHKLHGHLTEAQTRFVLESFSRREGVRIVSNPSIITLSGRQAQIATLVPQGKVTTGIKPEALIPPGLSAAESTNAPFSFYTMTNLLSGPMIDVLPELSDDGYTINLTVTIHVDEFLGYERPTNSVLVYADGRPQYVHAPLPKFRKHEASAQAALWDGQTLVLGGLGSEGRTQGADKVPLLGWAVEGDLGRTSNHSLVALVTATLVDATGKRIHSPEEMPFAQDGFPEQAQPAAGE